MNWHARALDLLTIVADAAWIFILVALVSALFSLAGPALTLPLALGVSVLAFASTRWIASIQMPLSVARVLSAALAVAALYVVVGIQTHQGLLGPRLSWPIELFHAPPDARQIVLAAGSTLAFWASGARLGLTDMANESLPGIFRIGIPVIISSVVLSIFTGHQEWLYPAIYMFFAATLTGFALGQVAGTHGLSLAGTWGRLLVVTLLVVLGGSLILALLTRTLFGDVLSFLANAGWLAVQAAAYVVGLGVSYIAEWIVNLITPLMPSNVSEYLRRVSEALDRPPPIRPDPNEPSRLPEWLPFLAQWGSITVVVLLIAAFVFLLFRGRFRRRERPDPGVRRDLSGETNLRQDLTGLLGNILHRKGRPTYKIPGRDTALGITYRLYYSLLLLAGQRGVERTDAETPYEFEGRAVKVLPAQETALLTEAFSRARYGEIAPSDTELVELRAAWLRMAEEPPDSEGQAKA